MKTCKKCQEAKPHSEFYTHKAMSNGIMSTCKNCVRRATAERHARMSKDQAWVLSELRRHREKSRRARQCGKVKPLSPEIKQATIARYFDKHPEKAHAHHVTAQAIRSKKLIKQPCEVCGDPKSQAHHDDYTKPLQVRWLCVPHHNEHHVRIREMALLNL